MPAAAMGSASRVAMASVPVAARPFRQPAPQIRTSVRVQLKIQRHDTRRGFGINASADTKNGSPEVDSVQYDRILLAILDSNPGLSSASKSALATAAALASDHGSQLTVLFVDDPAVKHDSKRITWVQGQLMDRGVEESRLRFLEEEVEASTGKGSVAVGEAADTVEADLVIMSSAAIHEKHADANLLAEFVAAPLLLLP